MVAKLGLFALVLTCSALACSDSAELGEVRPARPDAGEDAGPALRYWVGEVEDSDIRLGVAEADDQARVFFCGGPSSYATSTRWLLRPLAADGGFEHDEGGWQVSGTLSDDAITGTLRIGSEDSREFSARPVRKGTIAGLYEGQADCGRIGLIVNQADEDELPSAQGACVGTGHPPEQVNPILPIARKAGEIRVEVDGQESGVRLAGPLP
jgi:hypothetical protein